MIVRFTVARVSVSARVLGAKPCIHTSIDWTIPYCIGFRTHYFLSRLGVFTRNCSVSSTLALLGISFCVRCRYQKTGRVSYLLSRRPFLLVNTSGDRYVVYPGRSIAAVLNKTAC